jgi:hypothetical protein
VQLLDYGIFFYLLNRVAGGAAVVFTALAGIAMFVVVFGSLAGSIANTRTRPAAQETRWPQVHRRGGPGKPAPMREWEQVRREQLRQLGLDRQRR